MDGQGIGGRLLAIYRALFIEYGPQHWWPAREPFEVIVGAILTQNTAWTNVEKAIESLRAADKLSPAALRHLPEAELAGLIHSCGYFNVKARRLKAFMEWLGAECGDDLNKLFSEGITLLREKLLGIYGIGEETADSIILYAGNLPTFVIDAYTRRVFSRIGLTPEHHSYKDYRDFFMKNLPQDVPLFNEYHALLVRLGKEVCQKQPHCGLCCLNRNTGTGRDYPEDRYPCSGFGLE